MRFFKLFILILFYSCDFKRVIAVSFSKEFCSCYFVVKQSEKYCYDFASQVIPVSSYKIDHLNKAITAKALGTTSQSSYISQRNGCQINSID